LKKRKNIKEHLKDFQKVHFDKYNYLNSLQEYKNIKYLNTSTKIKIICPEHGEFLQTINMHKHGNGCPKCHKLSKKKPLKNLKEHINDFKKAHNNKYNYSKIIFKNTNTKIEIICPKHGSFFQTPNMHKLGSGCPKCKESKGERKIREFLEENNIKYSQEVKLFENYRFDFYLEDLNTVIEYDGKQHSEPVEYFGGLEGFLKTQERDRIKEKFLKENNIELLRINYKEFNNILTILTNITKT